MGDPAVAYVHQISTLGAHTYMDQIPQVSLHTQGTASHQDSIYYLELALFTA